MPRPRKPVNHGTDYAYTKRGCRCEECTEAHRLANISFRAKYEEHAGRGYYSSGPALHCLSCGDPVGGAVDKSDPRHKACRERRVRRRAAAERKLALAAAGRASMWCWTQGTCAQCGAYFMRHGQSSPFCSKACSRRARPTSRQFKISNRDRVAIYERDAWTCQLCSEQVDPDLPPLDDWAASLDHVIPQAWQLIPDHSPANLQLAHRICNSIKGDMATERAA